MQKEALQKKAAELRGLVLDVYEAGKMGHISSSFSSMEIMTALFYGGVMRFRPAEPAWEQRDRFILSKGHAGILYYSILADLGYFPKSALRVYGHEGSPLGVHVDYRVPGVEASSGSLACGLGIACGMALAAKLDQKNHMVFALLGDGECYEGAIWESAMHAAHLRLNNLVVIVDHNHMCCSGFIEENVGIEPLDQKWRAFGFDVACVDGHDCGALLQAFAGIRCRKSARPLCVIADTVKAKGLSSVENTPLCHGYAPNSPEAIAAARKELEGSDVYCAGNA